MILRHSWHADGPMSESLEELTVAMSTGVVAMVPCICLAYLFSSCVVTVKRPVGSDTLLRTYEAAYSNLNHPQNRSVEPPPCL